MTTIETTSDQWRTRLRECEVIFGRAHAVWELTRRQRNRWTLRLPDHLGGYILRGWEIDRELQRYRQLHGLEALDPGLAPGEAETLVAHHVAGGVPLNGDVRAAVAIAAVARRLGILPPFPPSHPHATRSS